MEFIKATRQYSTLENGSQIMVFCAQWNDCFLELSIISVPRIFLSSISFDIYDQFLFSEDFCTTSGLSISLLSNPSGSPYYNITPTTTPRHSLILDSSVLNPHGFLEPSVHSFRIDPSQFNENLRPLSNFICDFFFFVLF